MADRFRAFDELVDAVSSRSFDRPPAIVCNAHITGLAVARSLAARDVPVIAIDRNGTGVAPHSDAVDLAGRVTYPLDDADGFRDDVEALASATEHAPVAFPCMDEWVHAFAQTRPEGVALPFAAERIDAILDKESLYSMAEDLNVPHPETYRVRETLDDDSGPGPEVLSADAAAAELGFPLVVKPARKREFEEAIGTNVVEVGSAEEYEDVISLARDHGVRVMAQERVPVTPGEDRSYASYAPRESKPIGIVGNPVARHPPSYGTSCLVERVETPSIERRARAIVEETGFYGISEAEFVHDRERGEYVLLDVNTRPWKWIGLPVQAGVDLPYAAYADTTGTSYQPDPVRDATWISLQDYLASLAEGGTDRLTRDQWRSLVSGTFEDDPALTTAVYAPTDPDPVVQLLLTEFGDREYYCSC